MRVIASLFIGAGRAAVFVDLILEQVGVDRSDAHAVLAGDFGG